MSKYEVIREILNSCAGNKMRDVDVQEIEAESPEEIMEAFRKGKDVEETKTEMPNGDVIYELTVDGLPERIHFSKI